jgi:hypothetical protein
VITTILVPDCVTFYGRDWKVRISAETQGVKAAAAVADSDGSMAYFVLRALKGALKSLRVTKDGDRVILEHKSVAREFQARPIEALPRAELTIARVQIKDDATGAWRMKRTPYFELCDGIYAVDELFKAWFTIAHDVRVSECGKWAVSTAFRYKQGVRTNWLGELFAPVQRVGSAY